MCLYTRVAAQPWPYKTQALWAIFPVAAVKSDAQTSLMVFLSFVDKKIESHILTPFNELEADNCFLDKNAAIAQEALH